MSFGLKVIICFYSVDTALIISFLLSARHLLIQIHVSAGSFVPMFVDTCSLIPISVDSLISMSIASFPCLLIVSFPG